MKKPIKTSSITSRNIIGVRFYIATVEEVIQQLQTVALKEDAEKVKNNYGFKYSDYGIMSFPKNFFHGQGVHHTHSELIDHVAAHFDGSIGVAGSNLHEIVFFQIDHIPTTIGSLDTKHIMSQVGERYAMSMAPQPISWYIQQKLPVRTLIVFEQKTWVADENGKAPMRDELEFIGAMDWLLGLIPKSQL